MKMGFIPFSRNLPIMSLSNWVMGTKSSRWMSSARDVMEYDLCIVGAGPAGLAAAIRAKQVAVEKEAEISVCVVEKGADVGEADGGICKAEELGVDIFPGFAGKDVLSGPNESVAGVLTNDVGVDKNGIPKSNLQLGIELRAKATLLGEGCRGSLSQAVMKRYKLREACEPQTYALGIKEVWKVPGEVHREGTVWHTMGYPMPQDSFGGGFLYHMSENRVSVGLVVGMDYKNPYLSPFQEFQKFKVHPAIQSILTDGTCLQYGARTLNEGGIQSIPKLSFPGGALIGCSAGFLNVAKIKGTHTAMKSGMLAAESAVQSVLSNAEGPADLSAYEENIKNSWVWEELEACRNVRPGFKYGLLPGIINAAAESFALKGGAPWTLSHRSPDHESLAPASTSPILEYPKADGKVSFDITTSVYLSGTNHNHDQPTHLKLKNDGVPEIVNIPLYDKPETRYCPAGVYEYTTDTLTQKERLQINAQNCLHCKACDLKDPTENIVWTVPEGGGGPGYTIM